MSLLDHDIVNPVSILFANVSPTIVHPVGDKVYVRIPETFVIRGKLVTEPNAVKLTAISKYCGEIDSIQIDLPIYIPAKADKQELDCIKTTCINNLDHIMMQVKEYVDAFRR